MAATVGAKSVSAQLRKLTLFAIALSGLSISRVNAQHVYLDAPVKAEVFTGITGTAISDLQGDANYQANTPAKTVNNNLLEYPVGGANGSPPAGDVADNYGTRLTGNIVVDKTGQYVFYLSADDNGEFWLSTDSDPANAVMIAREPVWNPVRSFVTDASAGRDDTAPENVSAPITLTAGQKYAFIGYHKEGGGGDNFAVAARAAGEQPAADGSFPIFLKSASANVQITSQPVNVGVAAGSTATFSVGVSGPASFQWQKNGTDIPGATSASYTTAAVAAGDNGTKYTVKVISGDGTSVTSREASVIVVPQRDYNIGYMQMVAWNDADCSCASDIPSTFGYFGSPFGTFGAGGGTDPTFGPIPVDQTDSRIGYPDDTHENYTGAIYGYFVPDKDGTYYFHLKSDDPGMLFFNKNGEAMPDPNVDADGDGNPDFRVANETACCNDFMPAGDVKTGGPFTLTAGKKYGFLLMWHDITGGDYGQVAMTRDGKTAGLDQTDSRNRSTIPGSFLGSLKALQGPTLAIIQQPSDIHVENHRSGALSVITTAAPGITYQWQSAPAGSTTFTDVAGGTASSLTVNAELASNNTQYRVKVHAEGQDFTSDAAKLLVDPDVTAPQIVSAYTAPANDAVVITFNEPVSNTGATYTLNNGATVSSSEAAGATVVVAHTGAALTPNTSYTITANGVKDVSGNALTANTSTFTSGKTYTFPAGTKVVGRIRFQRFDGLADEAAIAGAIAAGTAPDVDELRQAFDQTVNQADNFSSLKTGWFIPPKTGNYVFFDASDDPSHLYLSTDSDPANKKLIARETAWSNDKEWTVSGGASSLADKRSDQFSATEWPSKNTITLVGGEMYYIEQTQHEGGGGDDGAATFKLEGDPDPANGTIALTGSVIATYADLATFPPFATPLVITNKVFNKGDNITLGGVTVSGVGPFTYQWYRNKMPIAGATSATLTINNADHTAIGDYSLKVSNANGSVQSNPRATDDTARLIMAGAFNIEAEDFNYEGGKTKPEASTMPYLGNAYNGLKFTQDIDVNNGPDESAAAALAYSRDLAADASVVEMKGPADPPDYVRGSFSVTNNYAIGWGSDGDWQNYTRTVPKGKYVIYAGTAQDGEPDEATPAMKSTLSKVTGATTTSQTVTDLGTFSSPNSGAWSSNDIYPLTDASGNIVQVDLDGEVTLRWTNNSGEDQDYLLLYCLDCATTQPGGAKVGISINGSNVTITSDSGGTVEATDALSATTAWSTVGPAPQTVSTTGKKAQFFRVKK
jgi:hypothetical protein